MSARVVVAMSGGVDSAVAAALLKEQGYDVIGITMRLWTEARPEAFRGRTQCCAVEDVQDARRVAQRLGIPHYTLNLEEPFRRTVVDAFIDAYAQGETPNPCLNCNTFIKFDAFLQRALALGADAIATGHYARRCDGPDGPELHCAVDPEKDQSYVLFTLSREALARTLFPVGTLPKAQVRAVAARYGLAVADKPDSTDICFVPGGDYRAFVRRVVPDRPGRFRDAAGRDRGEHPGVQHFTVGQRHGLGLATGGRAYVTGLDAERNIVHLGDEQDLLADVVEVRDVRWLLPVAPAASLPVEAKLRYRMGAAPGVLDPLPNGRVRLRLARPARAVAPGQAAVFYRGDRVLGGGVIARAAPSPARAATAATAATATAATAASATAATAATATRRQ